MLSSNDALAPLTIRGPWVSSHALLDAGTREVVLIDGGFGWGAVARIETALRGQGFTLADVVAILLTHGHLDHTINISRLREITGALVYAHPADAPFIAGSAERPGFSRWGGVLESIGRRCFHYQPPSIDRWMNDGDELPFWGGLEVVHLPGHTPGHCGFYSESRGLLIAGDLFANFLGMAQFPPRIFSVDRKLACQSIVKADRLIPADAGVLLNHGRDADPVWHREDLAWLARRTASTVRR
jgi:glyoxylase-like metal-dependent hydrolase (beta-lactamase superfamily II)